MKRYQAVIALALVCGFARGGELEDGMKAWESKDFAQAYKIFSKLAAAGDAEAQRQLGEMYGFGEGVPENLAEAKRWIGESQAHGNKAAAESLALVEQRATHKADIARYTTQYDGSDVALARFNCVKPEIPESSNTKKKIAAVNAKVQEFYACYGKFATNLNAQLPAGKAIPPQTAQLMNSAEFDQARALMDKSYAKAAEDGKRELDQVTAAEAKWIAASEQVARAEAEKTARDAAERGRGATEANRNTFSPVGGAGK